MPIVPHEGCCDIVECNKSRDAGEDTMRSARTAFISAAAAVAALAVGAASFVDA
jgi:hypothetical protein